ncbi:MAG: hypothetical protein L7V86_23175 [Verrucomicrobiales bacterium]|nr:hypothetical protein [Verrucomicrobiales bacterium]
MANAEAVALISVADYLADEKHAEVGHEYFTGCVVTMEGISRRQNTIAGNLFTAIHGKLHGGPAARSWAISNWASKEATRRSSTILTSW